MHRNEKITTTSEEKKFKQLQRKVLRQEKTIKGLKRARRHSWQQFWAYGQEIVYKWIKKPGKKVGLALQPRYKIICHLFTFLEPKFSPRAYKFVRKTLHLPHPATLRSWAGNGVCKPGFYWIVWHLDLKNIFLNTLPLTFNALFVFSKIKVSKQQSKP